MYREECTGRGVQGGVYTEESTHEETRVHTVECTYKRKTQTHGKEICRREVHVEGVYTWSFHAEKSTREGEYTLRSVHTVECTYRGRRIHTVEWSVHTRGRLKPKEEIYKMEVYAEMRDIQRTLHSTMRWQLSSGCISRTKGCGSQESRRAMLVFSFIKSLILHLHLHLYPHLHSLYFSHTFSHPPTLYYTVAVDDDESLAVDGIGWLR